MNRALRPSRIFFASVMIALGITGLVNGDFALVWQNVPAHIPGRTVLAYLCAIIEMGAGIGLLLNRTVAAGIWVVADSYRGQAWRAVRISRATARHTPAVRASAAGTQ